MASFTGTDAGTDAPSEGSATAGAGTSTIDSDVSVNDPDTSGLQSNDDMGDGMDDGMDEPDEPDIGEVCTSEYIAQSGALECSNVCQPVHCCFSGESLCEDVRLGQLICNDYSQCEVLYPTHKSSKELFEMAKHIDEICDEENVSTPKGRSECQGLCKNRLCCFDDGRKYSRCCVAPFYQGICGDEAMVKSQLFLGQACHLLKFPLPVSPLVYPT